MTDDSLFDRTTTRRSARRPPIIDQDGNEVHPGGGTFGASGFAFNRAGDAFGSIQFGAGPYFGP